MASRDLADITLTQLQKDINANFNTPWTRRSMWDRNYSETRLPVVPSSIIELLSHQNFAEYAIRTRPELQIHRGSLYL